MKEGRGMAKTFREWDVDQGALFPPNLLDLVPEGHVAHFVRNRVLEELDLGEVYASYSEERGYPPYHPAMMTALLLYGYCQGIYSSRRIARACRERVDFMAIVGTDAPDFRTVNKFRKRHLKALGGLFRQVLRLCRKAGMARMGHVALDGTKMRANASRHKAMSYGRMKKAEAELERQVAEWFEKAEAIDQYEDEQYGKDRRGDELPDWVADKQKRLEKIRQAKAELEAEAQAEQERKPPRKYRGGRKPKTPPGTPPDKAQKNFTDSESRIMKGPDGYVQAYNAQAAVDADSQVIVAQSVTNSVRDVHQVLPALEQIRSNAGRQARELSADAGYFSEDNLRELSRRRVRGYVTPGKWKHGAKAPEKGTTHLKRWGQQMYRRLRQGGYRSRYRLRKQTVEPVFGQIKQARGFRQFLLRGQDNVAGEWSLLCTAHNILKLAAATT
jgi:transposase